MTSPVRAVSGICHTWTALPMITSPPAGSCVNSRRSVVTGSGVRKTSQTRHAAGTHLRAGYSSTTACALASFLAPWLKKYSADVVVLGGNISGAHDLFGPALQARLGAVYPDAAVKVSLLGENAAMIGAARLLNDRFWEQVSNQLPRI